MKISMTVKEVAEYLGVNTDTIYTMVQQGEIPHFRLRSRIFFTKQEIDAWIEKMQKNSVNKDNKDKNKDVDKDK